MPSRSFSQRHPANDLDIRAKISAPVELISSTNMLSYNAPDLHGLSPSNSDDDSDNSPVFSTRGSSTSSLDSPPGSPAPNHLTEYFDRSETGMKKSSIITPAPAVPERANTHTVAKHVAVARQRSLREAPPTSLPTASQTTIPISPMTSNFSISNHPFGRELAQVNELAEEMGLAERVEDEEELLLRRKGLYKFGVDDYISEIQDLFGVAFGGRAPPRVPRWI